MLRVYANEAVFDETRQPLGEGETIEETHGKFWTDPLLVVIPDPRTLLDDIKGWIEPKNLCNGQGMRWEYQLDETLLVTIWFSVDVARLAADGTAGEHKSELQKRLSEAYVFKVNFENGTSYKNDFPKENENEEFDISVRMLYQLIGIEDQTWNQFLNVVGEAKIPLICDVILKLAAVEKKDDMTIILCIDGFQHLMPNGTKADKFYRLLKSLCSIITTKTQFFLLVVCAATIHAPIQQVLASSSHERIILVPPVICGADILSPENPSEARLVEDMDGHGCALEILETLFLNYRGGNVDLADLKLDPIVEEVWTRLKAKYQDLFQWTDQVYLSVLAAVLSGRKFSRHEQIPGTEMTVDTLLQYGLFRHEISAAESSSRITCAFVILWWMIKKLPVFKDKPENFAEFFTECSDVSWHKFERFVALFRTIKSVVYEKHQVNLSEFHSGACFGDVSGLSIQEDYCRRVVQITHKGITGTKKLKANDCTPCELDNLDMNCVYINASGASAADIFLKTNLVKDGSTEYVLETIQCKREQATMTEERFYKEREKQRDLPICF
ncbi:unnamed protein product [Aphanomyces euteiches]|nr:hypothetical protein Ae201684P_008080 [Aphanomyces euteiches]